MLKYLFAKRCLPGVLLITLLLVNGCASQRSSTAPSPSTTSSGVSPEALPPGYVKSYVVFGKRYYILGNSAGFRQSGLASWYGPKFHGRPTANGETYDMHQMTAAHKNLPLPTYVRVTNLVNRRSIVVRVNDRGPFIGERIIDLSHAAASKLDLIGPGTGQVEVVALAESDVRTAVPRMPRGVPQSGSSPTDTPLSPSTASAPATPDGTMPGTRVFVQVASFGNGGNADTMRRQLEQSGFNNVIIQSVQLDGRMLHRVKLGPYASAAEQNSALTKLHAIGLNSARAVSQ